MSHHPAPFLFFLKPTNSHLGQTGSHTTIKTGGDVSLEGAQVLGTVDADIGGSLKVASLQDTSTYNSKQQDASAQVTIGYGFSGSASASKSKVNSDYASVGEESGIIADDGGYRVNVQGGTTLDGGIITSTQAAEDAGLNSFSTSTLTVNDIQNHANYEGDSFGISGGIEIGKEGSAKPDKDGNPTGVLGSDRTLGVNKTMGYGEEGESQTSVTHAGVNTANVTITDAKAQAATGVDVDAIKAKVHTDTTSDQVEANSGHLENSFDANAVQNELDVQTRVTQQFDHTRQGVSVLIDQQEQTLRDKANEAALAGDTQKAQELTQQADNWSTGGLILDGIANALYSPNTNGITGTVAQVASPMLVEQVGNYFKYSDQAGTTQHFVAQSLLGAAISAASGNDALMGVFVSGGSEALAPMVANFLYGDRDLTPDEKATVSSIVSIGAVGLSSGTSTADMANASMQSQIVAENNSLKLISITAKTAWKLKKKIVNGKVSFKDFKDTLKEQGLDIIDDVMTLADGELTIDDAYAIIDLLAGVKPGDVLPKSTLDKIEAVAGKGGKVVESMLPFSVDPKQLGKKLGKHVEDFGGDPSNALDRDTVISKIYDIAKNPEKTVKGTFKGQVNEVEFRIKGDDVVITNLNGEFITIMKDGVNNPAVKRALGD